MNTNKNKMLYIVGSPRSGTYLLSMIFNSRFNIALPVETHFIPLFHRYLFLWGDLNYEDNRRRLLESIYEFLEIWTIRSEKGRDIKKIREFSLLRTKERAEIIIKNSSSYSDIVNNLFYAYAQIKNHTLYGDKSAFFNHIPLETLEQSTPNLKVIHIIRDGRDVCLSWMKTWFGPLTFVEAAELWVNHVEAKRKWGKKKPKQYLEIKFEDLIENPSKIYTKISAFLQLPLSESTSNSEVNLSSEMASVLSKGGYHSMLSQPLNKNNKDKWKTDMRVKDRIIFEYIAGSTLNSCGFGTIQQNFIWIQKLQLFFIIKTSKIKSFFSLRHWKIRLKNILPIAIWSSSLFGIQLSKILNRSYL